MITSKRASLRLTRAGSVVMGRRPGDTYNHAPMANTFIPAANRKNDLAVPVEIPSDGMPTCATKNGKMMALTADPMLPTMFIVAETVPDLSPPMSMQTDQLGEIVISTPKTATEKSSTKDNADR